MTTDNGSENLRALWQKQTNQEFSMDPNEIKKKFSRFQRKLRHRKIAVYAVSLGDTILLAYLLTCITPPIGLRIGFVLMILGLSFVVGQIWVDNRDRQKALENASIAGQTNCVDFYRAELVRRRNFHRGLWFWSRLLALLPGIFFIGVWGVINLPGTKDGDIFVMLFVAAMLLPFLAIWKSYRCSQKCQRTIDAIDAMKQAHGADDLMIG